MHPSKSSSTDMRSSRPRWRSPLACSRRCPRGPPRRAPAAPEARRRSHGRAPARPSSSTARRSRRRTRRGACVRVIAAANGIAKHKDYCYGGGYASFKSSCYDCSGSVSYALHGGRLLSRPMDSSGLERWGHGSKGRWITVYANSGHAFMKVAGLRFDTSMTSGEGPGWSKQMRLGPWLHKTSQGRLLERRVAQAALHPCGGSISGHSAKAPAPRPGLSAS